MLSHLEHLCISKCDSLTSMTALKIISIPEPTYFESGSTNFWKKLERPEINNCKNLNYLWQDGDLPTFLTSLFIENCPHFTSLMAMPPHLQELYIFKCDSPLASEFESGRFPTSLKSLQIVGCSGMVSVMETFVVEHRHIENIYISNCKNLRSLEFNGFSQLN